MTTRVSFCARTEGPLTPPVVSWKLMIIRRAQPPVHSLLRFRTKRVPESLRRHRQRKSLHPHPTIPSVPPASPHPTTYKCSHLDEPLVRIIAVSPILLSLFVSTRIQPPYPPLSNHLEDLVLRLAGQYRCQSPQSARESLHLCGDGVEARTSVAEEDPRAEGGLRGEEGLEERVEEMEHV